MKTKRARLIAILLLAGSLSPPAPAAGAAGPPPRVDFSSAFATPHRLTVGRPERSERTILDAEPGALHAAWTYVDLTGDPPAVFMPRTADWRVRIGPLVDGKPFPSSRWRRAEGRLPVLEDDHEGPDASLRIEVTGGETATAMRVTAANGGAAPRTFEVAVMSERGFFGYNPGHVDPARDRDCLLAGWGDRADRVLLVAVGADDTPVDEARTNAASVALRMRWTVPPGEKRTGWLVRPYRAYSADLPALRARDWGAEVEKAKAEWRDLLARSARIHVPDPGVEDAFGACLADLFIMR